MFQYRPPKSSVWGHLLRKTSPERARALFRDFLAAAVAEHTFGSATLTISDPTLVPSFESIFGTPAENGFQFPRLSAEQSELCLDELIKINAAAPAAAGQFALAQLFQITKWRIDNQDVPTESSVVIHFGIRPCISTFFQFETAEQFHRVRRILEDVGLCKLNEKHLKPVKSANR